jgi:membrane-bound inhibitor of C-type lysozyme
VRGAVLAAVLVAAVPVAAGPVAAEVATVRYLCERGVEVPATYVNGAEEGPVVVLNVEGTQITLIRRVRRVGARYGWPSGGSAYVWWTKGDAATLLWRDGETTIEEPVYSDCLRARLTPQALASRILSAAALS